MDPIYDHAGSMQRMGDDQQLFATMAGYLHRDSDRRLSILHEKFERGDLAGVERTAHTLKGQISNFGASRAWTAAARVEAEARERDTDSLPASITELSDAVGELLDALAPWVPAGQVRS